MAALNTCDCGNEHGHAYGCAIFACRVCGVQCSTSSDTEGAVCEAHCEDHDYEYDRMRAGHFCTHCDAQRPYDY